MSDGRLPAWVPGATVYHLHALGAAGAPAEALPPGSAPGAGLATIGAWLPHVEWLGCEAVLLTPIASSSTHGYDTVDPLVVDPRLGGDADWDRFADEARRRGLRVLLDAVVNHVGRDFGPFRDVLAHGRRSPYAGWFRIDWPSFEGSGGTEGYATFEGHGGLVALDHDEPAVLDWAITVTRHWLDRGADGWRFDAAYAVDPAFLAVLVGALRASHPDALLFGEVIHGDYTSVVAATGLDAVTQYELHKAVWSALHDGNLFELAWSLRRHADFAQHFAPVTFAGNHDVTRVATAVGDPRLAAPALAVVATVPGVPCLYYGDEFAWTGTKEHRPGGDDAVRPPLPADGFARSDVQADALDTARRLVALRRQRPWLTAGRLVVGDVADRSLRYEVHAGDAALHVALDADLAVPTIPAGWDRVDAGAGWAVGERRAP
ncbi:MAG TPA: alpha-amylase family glycosyl hydrolase [Acidimicrobiales bacterium]|nr:alpha-amylase family glycosyl hydrolase [Acidimicrobiales bacterium]